MLNFNFVYLIPVIVGFVVDGLAEIETIHGQFESTHCNVELNDDILKVGNWTLQDGRPEGWDNLSAFDDDYATINRSDGRLTLNATADGTEAFISTTIDLPRDVDFLTFVVRLRGPNIERQDTDSAGGGVTVSLIDGHGKMRVFPRINPNYNNGPLSHWDRGYALPIASGV